MLLLLLLNRSRGIGYGTLGLCAMIPASALLCLFTFLSSPATAGEQSVLNLHFQFANTLAAANREGRAAAAEIVEFLITKGTDGHPGQHSDLGQV